MARLRKALKELDTIIDWQEAERVPISIDEWNNFRKSHFPERKRIPAYKARPYHRTLKCPSYCLSSMYEGGKWVYWDFEHEYVGKIFAITNGKPTIYSCNRRINDSISGHDALKALTDGLYARYGKKLQACYGAINEKDDKFAIHQINRCVGAFIGSDRSYCGRPIKNAWKADIKSAYPAQTSNLPDWHTARRVNGRIAPTMEEPFAFYLKSHHVAEYGVFDTHEDMKSPLYSSGLYTRMEDNYDGEPTYRFEEVPDKDEVTILCKPSPYDMRPIFEEWFDKRRDNAVFKEYMVKAIGCLDYGHYVDGHWFTPYGTHNHLRAIILARHNHLMCQIYDNLVKVNHFTVLSVMTDSIVWCGGPSRRATHESKLGNFVYEIENGVYEGKATGIYFCQDDKTTIFKHASYGLSEDDAAAIDSVQKFEEFIKNPIPTALRFDKATGWVEKITEDNTNE